VHTSRPSPRLAVVAVLTASVAFSCGSPPPADAPVSPPYSLARGDADAGWRVLFGGRDLTAWRGFRSPDTAGSDGASGAPDGWSVEAGAIYFDGRLGAPDLITREVFADFELVLEFRTTVADNNSGILIRVTEAHRQTYHTGPEFQILADAKRDVHRSGANYALHAPQRDALRPQGKWNEARIIARGAHVEHWLNGERIVTYELWSDDWERRVADSKFVRMPDYGRAREGHIALQAHASPVWFRNVRIRRLDP